MESLMQLFYDEANEMVEGMEQVLLALESGEPDPETVNALFRYAHSFKGNSAAMGFTHLSKFTHGLESAMESLRKEQRTLTPELATLLLQAVDVIRTLLERTRTEGDVGDPTCEALLQQINAVINGETPQPITMRSTPASADLPNRPLRTGRRSTASSTSLLQRLVRNTTPYNCSASYGNTGRLSSADSASKSHRWSSSRPTPATVAGKSSTRRRSSLRLYAHCWSLL
jgi:chemotaxis protein histidine kinase CheA